MNYYLIFAIELLLAGLVLWRIRKRSGQPVGCLAGGFVVIWTVTLTSMVLGLGHAIFKEGLLGFIRENSSGSQAVVSPGDWAMAGMICLILVLMAAGMCSLIGFAITGHHPGFCKAVWKTLAAILLLPVVTLPLLAASFGGAYVICMRIASPEFDDMGWGWMLLFAFFSLMALFGFVGLVACMLEINGSKLQVYDSGNKDRSFRRIDGEQVEKTGGVL